MYLRRLCCLRLALLPFVATSLHAQTAVPQSASDQPAIKARVSMVLVDVVVTKGKGEAVPGLHKDDFQVLEDGEPQSVSFFEEHQAAPPTPIKLPPMPANVFTNYPTVKTADSVNVLLLDSLNTQARDQAYVRAQMIRYLRSAQPGARLAIFTLGSRLRMVRGMTADSSGLLVALSDPKSGTNPQVLRQLPTPMQKDTDELMIASQRSPEGIAAIKAFLAEEGAQLAGDRIEITLQAFQQLARYLSPIPGRKNVMWVSGSFPISFFPATGTRGAYPTQYQSDVQQTANVLTADQVAVYPISATGLVGDAAYDPTIVGKPTHEGYGDQSFDQIAMETLARDTGGKAFYNTNDLTNAMTEAINTGSHFYTLTYTPANTRMDGNYRRIELKALDSDYKLAYRRGYYAENAKTEQAAERRTPSDPLLPLMGFGMPDFAQILYKVRVLPSDPQPKSGAKRAGSKAELKDPAVRYGVDFAISAQDLKLDTTPDGVRHGNIEVTLIAYDREGKPLNMVTKKTEIALQPNVYAALQQVGLQLHKEIDVPTGDVYLHTGIYDLNSSKAGTLGIPLSNVAARKRRRTRRAALDGHEESPTDC